MKESGFTGEITVSISKKSIFKSCISVNNGYSLPIVDFNYVKDYI